METSINVKKYGTKFGEKVLERIISDHEYYLFNEEGIKEKKEKIDEIHRSLSRGDTEPSVYFSSDELISLMPITEVEFEYITREIKKGKNEINALISKLKDNPDLIYDILLKASLHLCIPIDQIVITGLFLEKTQDFILDLVYPDGTHMLAPTIAGYMLLDYGKVNGINIFNDYIMPIYSNSPEKFMNNITVKLMSNKKFAHSPKSLKLSILRFIFAIIERMSITLTLLSRYMVDEDGVIHIDSYILPAPDFRLDFFRLDFFRISYCYELLIDNYINTLDDEFILGDEEIDDGIYCINDLIDGLRNKVIIRKMKEHDIPREILSEEYEDIIMNSLRVILQLELPKDMKMM